MLVLESIERTAHSHRRSRTACSADKALQRTIFTMAARPAIPLTVGLQRAVLLVAMMVHELRERAAHLQRRSLTTAKP
jgi:hypothetical protein